MVCCLRIAKKRNRDIFERAAARCSSEDPIKRGRGADILCQLRRAPLTSDERSNDSQCLFREESYSLITKMLETERDLHVLESAVSALGHLYNEAGIPLILSYRDHADTAIRFAVTCALGNFPNDLRSVDGLLKLTSDPDADVRDWAVFGLGVQGDVDTPKIREALLRALDDENRDVREEAAVGLGKRRDQRLIPALRVMLDKPEFSDRVAEATTTLLGLDGNRPEWSSADYLAALNREFG